MLYQPLIVPTTPVAISINGFDSARRFFADHFADAPTTRESLFVAYLNGVKRCLDVSRHDGDEGGIDWPLRAILLNASRLDCSGLIVAHNHPSGDPTPSASDRHATKRRAEGGAALDITLLDHLVFGGERCVSFRRMGLL